MTITDSLQTLGRIVFYRCYKLVFFNVDTWGTDAVVVFLRSKQQQKERIIKQQQMEADRAK